MRSHYLKLWDHQSRLAKVNHIQLFTRYWEVEYWRHLLISWAGGGEGSDFLPSWLDATLLDRLVPAARRWEGGREVVSPPQAAPDDPTGFYSWPDTPELPGGSGRRRRFLFSSTRKPGKLQVEKDWVQNSLIYFLVMWTIWPFYEISVKGPEIPG